jgi:activator of 2-hydroxyglutaryl-CoA dehydratase/predicted nucleotide-binding protein (sugar kinase/HSP70/actin superfamily)
MKTTVLHVKNSETMKSGGLERLIGIDMGAETIKLAELFCEGDYFRVTRREIIEHHKQPGAALVAALRRWDWTEEDRAVVTGRFAAQICLPRIPTKQAQIRGFRYLFGDEPATVVNIGSHGFTVLELRANGLTMFRESSRCSQGTGNFLRQLVERFSLTVEEASALCVDIANPAPLSGRCPVILKTDMTHLANKGEDRGRILAGLFDAVCENVLALVKPGSSPARVLLTGGVSRSARVRRVLGEALAAHGMSLLPCPTQDSLCIDAIGCALIAAENSGCVPALEGLLIPPPELKLERLESLADSRSRVHRMSARNAGEVDPGGRKIVLGLDIGSTGSKIVALDATTHEPVWESYRQTLGNPVGAAQDLIRRFDASPFAGSTVAGFGATGSGREIVGSLLANCYGKEAVFVVNEIVAHAAGALHFDSRVDTIFEIGGQDAKYIRLAEGRIVDCALNEACSAGTGSFIAEQGGKFSGMEDVRRLGEAALSAKSGVSLGQHCSVFMAEVIDEAIAAGVEQSAIISGLYDSIIKNYLNRVKGNRSVGKVIFCQGMPFSADALAAAVARQTGCEVIVPPNPGTVGALGIALLAARGLWDSTHCTNSSLAPQPLIRPSGTFPPWDGGKVKALDLQKILGAVVEQKETFVCGSKHGCGGAGNHCRIERLRARVGGEHSSFTWGGACSLHDKGARKKKLPAMAPDPFREREELVANLVARLQRGTEVRPRIAMSDEFILKGLFPFFAAYFHSAGFDLEIVGDAGPETLKRGIQAANVPFCAPMQLFHGVAEKLFATGAEWVFIPMLRSLPREKGQGCAVVCPIVQSAPDIMRCNRAGEGRSKVLAPVIDFDACHLESPAFMAGCEQMARELKLSPAQQRSAWRAGIAAQQAFAAGCEQIGRRALEFCREHDVVPVVVLGRSYTIYNQVLNSNVPAILREQGAIGIPTDCFPVGAEMPLFEDMYWGYGQTILRAAHQVRRTPGVFAIYCSNYSCGPDSFNLHFAAYVMEGKPFAVVETDGHSGDAGTKTRVEAFLHCVEEHRRLGECNSAPKANDFTSAQFSGLRLAQNRGQKMKLLIPHLGPASNIVAAIFRGSGFDAESLPEPDMDALRRGRRYTSGKECLPMPLTLGALLQRLERAKEDEHFVYLMTSTDGPCRFGVYNLLNNIVLEKLGWRDRVRIFSPKATGYFDDLPGGTEVLVLAGVTACDLLFQARLDVRPGALEPRKVEETYARFHRELAECITVAARKKLSLPAALWEAASGRILGIRALLERAGREFAALRGAELRPVVELTGEIYVRNVDFSNDYLIEKLEARGLRVHLSPMTEWINYCGYIRKFMPDRNRLADSVSDLVRTRVERAAFGAIAPSLGWKPLPTAAEALDAAAPYIHRRLHGEAVLTVGGPLHEWRHGQIDGVVSVGPLECMPTKIAEAQYCHLAEREGVLNLTLAFNGEPINTTALDNFAYEVKARFEGRHPNAKRGLQARQAERSIEPVAAGAQ